MANEELELPAGYGVPSGSTQKYETWKLKNTKDGETDELILRVLPLMKSLVQLDDFGVYWALHYGWNGVNEKDPSKPAYHPFLCVEEKNYGMITNECPACKYRNGYMDKLKLVESDPTKAELKGKLVGWLKDHGRDGKFRIPCINKQGQFGIFQAPYGVVMQLRNEMKKLREQNYPGTTVSIKPAGRKGLWFKITRTNRPSTTSDKVEVNRIANPDGSEIKDFHVITDEQLGEAQNRIPDLLELKNQNRIRVEQIEALIALDKAGRGSSDPVEVDRILELGKVAIPQKQDVDYTGKVDSAVSEEAVTKALEAKQPVSALVVKPASVEAPVVATTVPPVAEVVVKKEEPKAPVAVNGADMSDDEFDSMFK